MADHRRHEWADVDRCEPGMEMTKKLPAVRYVLVMIAVVVSVDFLFFKNRFWERLIVNIGIVLAFIAFDFRFTKHS
jgi:hypothetical protein